MNMLKDSAALRMATAYLGGPDILRLAERYFGDGVKLDDLLPETKLKRSTLHAKLETVYAKLSQHGGIPPHWARHRHGPARRY